MKSTVTRTVGQTVIDILASHGIDRAFCVPGESYLGLMEAVRERGSAFDLVVCRHEGGAAYMAEAAARVSGRPGVCMVTRGPGSCNASIGILTAQHEGTPMLLLVGDVTSGTKGQGAFQDIDLHAFFGRMAKQVVTVHEARGVEATLRQALRTAMTGKPGPVVVAFPEDVQFESLVPSGVWPIVPERMAPTPDAVNRLSQSLQACKAPLLLLGGTQWTPQAKADLTEFAQRLNLPVATTFRRLDLIDNDCPCYVGSIGVVTPPALASYLEASDLILLLGGHLGEIETARYSRLTTFRPDRRFVQVGPQIEALGQILQPHMAITSDMESFCSALSGIHQTSQPHWQERTAALRSAFEAFREPVVFAGKVNPGCAVQALSEVLPENTICTMGAGNYTHFVLRHHRLRPAGTLLAPICAPMGYSVPAAIAAALEAPQREVLAYAGDGCFLMNAQELVIAVQRQLRLSIVILNNGIFGAIRMHQEVKYPGRPIATDLHNPDFVLFAQAMGMHARRLSDHTQLASTWQAMRRDHAGPFLVELLTDPDIIAPGKVIAPLAESGS